MINFVLDDLCRVVGVGLNASLQFQGLVLNLDGFITFTRCRAAEKRQTALLGIIRIIINMIILQKDIRL